MIWRMLQYGSNIFFFTQDLLIFWYVFKFLHIIELFNNSTKIPPKMKAILVFSKFVWPSTLTVYFPFRKTGKLLHIYI